MVKKANELLEEYIKEYPFYTELNFSSLDYEDTIPKLLVFTQLIIDELIKMIIIELRFYCQQMTLMFFR